MAKREERREQLDTKVTHHDHHFATSHREVEMFTIKQGEEGENGWHKDKS